MSDAEKRLFPGLTGMIKPEEKARGSVPQSILDGLERMKMSKSLTKEDSAADSPKEPLVGAGKGMVPAQQGMRVVLAPGCKGNAVTGEEGPGAIVWVGKDGQVCHVRWDGAT